MNETEGTPSKFARPRSTLPKSVALRLDGKGGKGEHRFEQGFLVMVVVIGYLLPRITLDAAFHQLQLIWWTFAFAVAGIGLLSERRQLSKLARVSTPLVLLLILACISTLWSIEPSGTLRRAPALVGSAILSYFFAIRLGPRRALNDLSIGIAILGFISLFLILFIPDVGIMPGEYSGEVWEGCFATKNSLGQAMVLGIVTVACSMQGSRGIRLGLQVAALSVFAVLLVGSLSGTSIAIAIIMGVICPIFLWCRRTRNVRPAIVLGVAGLIFVLAGVASGSGTDALFALLGKDSTLTGRTELWQYLFSAINDKPFLGYGYKAFWLAAGGPGDHIRDAVQWRATQAHNGFIEVALDFGLVGEVLVLVFLALALRQALKSFWMQRGLVSAWPLFTMIACIVSNGAEASVAKYYEVYWVVFVMAFVFAASACLSRSSAVNKAIEFAPDIRLKRTRPPALRGAYRRQS